MTKKETGVRLVAALGREALVIRHSWGLGDLEKACREMSQHCLIQP